MRKTTMALIAGAGALFAATTGASAQSLVQQGVYYGDEMPAATQVRTVCDQYGRCWEQRRRPRVVVRESYGYAPGYYGGRRYYEPRPGVSIRAPGVSVGVGGW